MVHIVVLPRADVRRFLGLYIIPLVFIPQEYRRHQLVYDYTWIGLHGTVLRQSLVESMQFGQTLQRLLHIIVHSNPQRGLVFMSIFDKSNVYTRVLIHP